MIKLHDLDLRDKMINEGDFASKAIKNLTNLSGETFVIYLSGGSLNEENLLSGFCEDVVALRQAGVNIIIIHEAGIFLNKIFDKFNIKREIVNDVILADKENIEIFEMVLSGYVNKKIVSEISKIGGLAIGICGKDGGLFEGKKTRKTKINIGGNIEQILKSTSIGEISNINPDILLSIEEAEIIPIISPIASGEENETLYLDAINVGSIIATALLANRYIILSDDVLKIEDKLVSEVTYDQVTKLIENNQISNEVKKLLKYSMLALENHIDYVHIIDSSISHAILLELLSDEGIGTKINLASNIQ